MINTYCNTPEHAAYIRGSYLNCRSDKLLTIIFCKNHIEFHPILDKNLPQTQSAIQNLLILDHNKINKMEVQYKNSDFQILTLITDFEKIKLKICDSQLVREQLAIHIPQINFMNHYKILEKIRTGGQGQIVKCLSYADNQVYAAKILNNSQSYTKQEVEIQKILAKHPHQNVLSMKEFFQDQQHTIIVFPFISGGTLYNNKEYKNIKKTLKQALKGLQHIHQLGLIHRDIKMDNIMIDENETIKIIDFGFAINKNETNLIEERCGTIDYMAPEVLNEEEYDEKADIYSLAQVFHILLTGKAFRIKSRVERCKGNFLQIDKNQINEPELIHLINNMIKRRCYRFSATQCLNHQYFQKKQISERVVSLKSLIFKSPFTPDNSPKQFLEHSKSQI